MKMSPVGKLVLLLAGLPTMAGCREHVSDDAHPKGSASSGQNVVTMFAAASATNAMDHAIAAFTNRTGIQVQTSYAASSTLARQIVNGADADVFLSANEEWADYVEGQATVVQRRNLLGNRLVIIVPAGSQLRLDTAADLLGDEVQYLALGDPEAVPAGKYAKQALMKLRLWEKLKDRIAAAKDVRQALTYVETGAAEAGIVYATDAAVSPDVKIALEIPQEMTEPVRYPVVLLQRDRDNPPARALYVFLDSPEAAGIFEKAGFVVLSSSRR